LIRRGEEDNGAAHYMNPSTRSIEFLQIEKLACKNGDKGPYIKKHSVKGQVHYELLPQGLKMAQHIRTRQFPVPPGHYRSSKIHSLEQVDEGRYDNIYAWAWILGRAAAVAKHSIKCVTNLT